MKRIIFIMCTLLHLGKTQRLPRFFRKMNPPCSMECHVYQSLRSLSLIQCADQCFGKCSRLLWHPTSRDCMLQSEDLTLRSTSLNIVINNTWSLYNKDNRDCRPSGYDYDLETNTCIKLVNIPTGITWTDARTQCKEDSADLISITTNRKLDFLDYYLGCKGNMWVGLKQKTWMTGENFTNFFGRNVDFDDADYNFLSDTEQYCGKLSYASNDRLQDHSCNIRKIYSFVCEIVLP